MTKESITNTPGCRENLRCRLAALPGATEEYPFTPTACVFKVGGKMFAVTDTDDDPVRVTLKGTPEDNEIDRAEYPAVRPGYHMNKRHWNTVTLDGSVPDDVLTEMIRASYLLVVCGLPRARRPALTEEQISSNHLYQLADLDTANRGGIHVTD